MASVRRSLTLALTLSMFVCGALSKTIINSKNGKSLQPPGVLRLFRDGRTTCESGGESGVCYAALNCLRVAGVFGNNCPGSEGVCCLFYRQCGQRSSQEVSYFRSGDEEAGSACSYQVVKRSSNHCGMRVKLEQLELPADCQTRINIEGVHKGKTIGKLRFPERQNVETICNTEAGNEYSFDTSNLDEVRINMESSGGKSGTWKIRVTQVHCNEFDAANQHDSHIPAIWPPPLPTHPPHHTHPTHPPVSASSQTTAETTGTTAKYCWWGCSTPRPSTSEPRPTTPEPRPTAPGPIDSTDYSRCGVKGPNTRSFSFRANNNNISRVKSNAFIVDTTWGNPPRNDSDHQKTLNKICEQKFPSCLLEERVTFGKDSGPREYPWQVAMKVRGRFHCGASIIGDQYILTAAHCVTKYKRSPSSLYLSLGDYDLSTSHEQPNYVPTVERVTVHPAYSRTTLRNDLAVLKLTKKITFSSTIRPVCLAPAGLEPTGKIAIVTGWGRNENNQLQDKLKELASEVTTNKYCGGQWESNGAPRGFITKDMMCMSPIGGDSCNGDSGGPSVMEIGGTHYQIGIVSFGSGSCVDPELPGVYTRVTSFRDWIMQQMN